MDTTVEATGIRPEVTGELAVLPEVEEIGEHRVEEEELVGLEDPLRTRERLGSLGEEDSSQTGLIEDTEKVEEAQEVTKDEEGELQVEEGEEVEEAEEGDGTFQLLSLCETDAHHLYPQTTTVNINHQPCLSLPLLIPWSLPPPTFDNSPFLKSRLVSPLLLLDKDFHHPLLKTLCDPSSIPLDSVSGKETFVRPSTADLRSQDWTSSDERFDKPPPTSRTRKIKDLQGRELGFRRVEQQRLNPLPPTNPPSTRRPSRPHPPPPSPSCPRQLPLPPNNPTNASLEPPPRQVLAQLLPIQPNHIPSLPFLLPPPRRRRTILSPPSTGQDSTMTAHRAGSLLRRRTIRARGWRRRGMSCTSWRGLGRAVGSEARGREGCFFSQLQTRWEEGVIVGALLSLLCSFLL
ncbi:hypothetical protein BDY24DRAFT_259062 [Mrakia frigida]|uniref:uncharacterized protein n=1 Tax=Mrakia frigida TaxID=29902 RepID=UPI003FCBF90A